MKQFIILLAAIITLFPSCKKYLDKKPDKKWVLPSSLQDLSASLDYTGIFNVSNYPYLSQVACDDYYLNYADWLSSGSQVARETYLWKKDGSSSHDWGGPYEVVYRANIVLDQLPNFYAPSNQEEWNRLWGSALFYRAFAFYEVAQVYAKGYDSNTASTDLGIPLRLTSNFNIPSVRSTVQETYDRIIFDLKEAAPLLPVTPLYKTRPSRSAAYAMLARAYLAMQMYAQAGVYADSALQYQGSLIDYNTVSQTSNTPFTRFNAEVVFYATGTANPIIGPVKARVDTGLYALYTTNDLRKSVYFRSNSDGSIAFKGNYDDFQSGSVFRGLAVDELFLISAESKVRGGDVGGAMNMLNALLVKRWKIGTFIPFSETNADAALRKILAERRKELVFRGHRWTDLRRLNKEPGLAVTLYRILNGKTYTLLPNSNGYVQYIPDNVIMNSNMQQNPD